MSAFNKWFAAKFGRQPTGDLPGLMRRAFEDGQKAERDACVETLEKWANDTFKVNTPSHNAAMTSHLLVRMRDYPGEG